MTATLALILLTFFANVITMFVFWLRLRSIFSEKRILSSLRSEIDHLITDLDRETDRDVALLEGKIREIRGLMDEADRRILLAHREAGKRKDFVIEEAPAKPAMPAPSVSRTVPPEEPQDRPPVQSARREPERPRVSEPARPLVREPAMSPVITKSPNQIKPLIPVNEQVLTLARKGISADMIASRLSIPLGEVELIINMNHSSL